MLSGKNIKAATFLFNELCFSPKKCVAPKKKKNQFAVRKLIEIIKLAQNVRECKRISCSLP